jgi:predicted P-loop ATPase
VALVASGIEEKIINHTLIVFSGRQGIGKSRWMQKLVPPHLKEAHYYSGSVDPGNKDSLTLLAECLWVDLDELETLNKSEIGELKHLITLPSIKVRRPYDKYHEHYPRRASLMGSVNTPQFLNDTTGSRRFLAFEVLKIDHEHTIDIDLVYAQALSLFKSDFRHWFDHKDIEKITKANEQFQIMTFEEELLTESFEPVQKEAAIEFLNATEMLQVLSDINGYLSLTNSSVIAIGKLMTKHGFSRVKVGKTYKYAVKRKIAGLKIDKILKEVYNAINDKKVFLSKEDKMPSVEIKMLTNIVFLESALFKYFDIDYDSEPQQTQFSKIQAVIEDANNVSFEEQDIKILKVLLKVHKVPTSIREKKDKHNAVKIQNFALKQKNWV